MLSERALKGLAFEAVRTGTWEDETLWSGVANEARRLEAVRHRTGKGEWYAVVELARAHRDLSHVWAHPLGARMAAGGMGVNWSIGVCAVGVTSRAATTALGVSIVLGKASGL